MVKPEIAKHKIEEMRLGQRFCFLKSISEKDVDDFAAISGDFSPLHMDEEFARRRGFSGRVVHGALLSSYISQLIGVRFPGENCLLQSLSFKFLYPVYITDTIEISAMVEQISLGASVIILNVAIENVKDHVAVVKGKAQVGFTKDK